MGGPRAAAVVCAAGLMAPAWFATPGRMAPPSAVPRIQGFSVAGSAAEAARERDFLAMPSAKVNEADFDVMTAAPHHLGSPYEIALADYVARQYASFGLQVSRYEYSVAVPWPDERHVDIVAPDRVALQVDEDAIPGDPWAAIPGILPAYAAYSPSGDVTADVVYVNFGVPSDYDTLSRLGVDVRGKIVLARFGGAFRGVIPKVAAEHGAVGCLIYSDPHEDGYSLGDAYPAGAFRGPGMVQRGTMLDIARYPGDPATPGRPSKAGVERLPMDGLDVLPSIPVQPLSYRDASAILTRLQGPIASEAWRGALPITYHTGPGPAAVRLALQMSVEPRRVINVIGRIEGAERPDEWVIVGSHRDAWTFGAADPVSGHVSVMAVARAMGEMLKAGWRPRRTVLFASWDGEEQGMLGSTEWAEEFADELQAKAAVYVNRDSGASGPFFTASATDALAPFVTGLAQSVRSDEPSQTLYDRWLWRTREQTPDGHARPDAPTLGALGSGSDYTSFLQHLGIASLDLAVHGRAVDGAYHSTYDDPAWFKTFIDPHFTYSVLASQATGVAVLRLADAELLPLDYEAYGRRVREYVGEIETEAIKRSAVAAARIDFNRLKSAADRLARAGADFRRRGELALDAGGTLRPPARVTAKLVDLDRRLIQAERDLLEPAGLPDRPWFKHVVYAPGLYTGYAVKTIPGVREAVEAGNFARAAEQARVVIRALERAAATLRN